MKTNFDNIPELNSLLERKNNNDRKITSLLNKFLSPAIMQNKNMQNYINELDKMFIYLIEQVDILRKWTHLIK